MRKRGSALHSLGGLPGDWGPGAAPVADQPVETFGKLTNSNQDLTMQSLFDSVHSVILSSFLILSSPGPAETHSSPRVQSGPQPSILPSSNRVPLTSGLT